MTVATDLLAVIAKLSSAERELLNLRLGNKWKDYLATPSALSEQQIADLVCVLRPILPALNVILAEVTNSLAVIGTNCAGIRSIFGTYAVLAGDIATSLQANGTFTVTPPASPTASQTITVWNVGTGTITVQGVLTKAAIDYAYAELSPKAKIKIRWNGTTWDVIYEYGTIVYIPLVVYAVWTAPNTSIVLSEGNLVATYTYDTPGQVISSITKTSGKWYCEVTAAATLMDFIATTPGATSTIVANGQVVGFAIDADADIYYLYVNNVLVKTGYGQTGALGITMSEGDLEIGCTGTLTANFGASAFTYSVPSGYNAGLYE